MFNQLFKPHAKTKNFRSTPQKVQVATVEGQTVTFSDEKSHLDPRLNWRSMTISAQIANNTLKSDAPSASIAPTLEQVTEAYNTFKTIHDRIKTEEQFEQLYAKSESSSATTNEHITDSPKTE